MPRRRYSSSRSPSYEKDRKRRSPPRRRRSRTPEDDRRHRRSDSLDRQARSPVKYRGGLSKPPADHPEANPGNNLYVSSLSLDTKEAELTGLFEKYGRLKDVRVVLDPYTKESRGFGFVTFEREEDAEEAVGKLDKTELNGRTIKVEKARRCKPHASTPGGYCGPPGASSKYRHEERRHRSRSPGHRRRRSVSYSNGR